MVELCLKVENHQDPLLDNISSESQVWMSHGDTITDTPEYVINIARTEDVKNAAYRFLDRDIWGIQFHQKFIIQQKVKH